MPLRCAVAGLNRGALFATMLAANPDCELVAACDARPEKLAQFSGLQTFTRFEEMLDRARPDVVAIITPGPDHGPQSAAALQAGVNVLVETPNVYSVQQAQQVVSLARAGGLKYMLAEDYVYMGWCRRLGEIIGEGTLGDILAAGAEYTHDCRSFVLADESGAIVPWSRLGQPGVTPLWRLGDLPPLAYSSHTLGPLLALMDDRCVSVTGLVGGRGQVAGVEVFPLETAVLQTQRGAVISLTNGFILSHAMGFAYALYGARGSARIFDFGGPRALISTDQEGGAWRDLDLPWEQGWAGGTQHLQTMVDDYIRSVVEDTPPPFDEARSMDFCLPGVLAHESAKRGGERLEVPLF